VSWYSPIIAPVKSFFSRSLSTKSDPTYQVTAQFYTPGQPMWSDRNYHAFVVEGYKKCGPVYACVQKIAQAAAGVKWKLYTDESMKREIPSHPLLDLWRKPNPRMGSSELVEQIFGFWHLAGNSYLYASRLNPNEPPVELWPLFPDQMKIVAGQGDIAGYVYGYGGPNPRVFELEDIMHLKFASYDERSFYGLSPIEVAMRTIDRLNAGNEWNMALMQNSGQPSALFTSKSHLTVEQRNQIKSELRKKYSGKRNAGMPLVLEADMGYQQMAINPKELDWLESRGFDERGVCMIMDVPSILLSDYEGQTYANRKEAKQTLFTENVLPKMDRTVGHVNMWLVPMYEDLKRMGAYFSYDKKDIEVLAELYTAVEQQLTDKATNGWNNGLYDMWTAQELQGVKPDANGKGIYKLGPGLLCRSEDLQAFAEACLEKIGAPPPAPLMLHPGQPQLPPPKPGTTVTEVDDDGNPLDDPQKMQGVSPVVRPASRYQNRDGSLKSAMRQTKILDLTTKEDKAAYMTKLEEQRVGWEDEITERLEKYFKGEQKTIAKALEACSTEQQAESAIEHMLSGQDEALKQLIYNIWYDVAKHFSEDTYNQLTTAEKDYNPHYQKKSVFSIFTTKIISWLLNLAATKVKQITDTTRDQLRKALADGVAAGESIPEIAKRVDQLYLEQIIPNRSTTIARTEVIGSSSWSAIEGAKESGLTLNKIWLATEDSRTRPDHADADGQEVGMDEPFIVGGVEMQRPGDGPADQVINCRCTVYFKRIKADEKAMNHIVVVHSRQKVSPYRAFMEAFV